MFRGQQPVVQTEPGALMTGAFQPGALPSAPRVGRAGRLVSPRLVLLLAVLSLVATRVEAEELPAVDYATEIKPLLTAHCVKCHGPSDQKAGLRLDTAALLRTGGDSGPAVSTEPAEPALLVQALLGEGGVSKMPPKAEPQLSPEQIALVKRWVAEGAKSPAEEPATDRVRRTSSHWAFQPVRRPAVPEPAIPGWGRTPVDAFIAQELVEQGLAPSPEADRLTLLRRVSLDLTGLLPTPAEVEAWLAETTPVVTPEAYDRLVDKLLASPHYGERWGRHWLDAARYADSNGFTIDSARDIWKYRDWVIDAVNRDLPYDQFVLEQLAGDLLENASLEQKIATGFHRNTLVNEEGGTDPEQFRVEAVSDRVATTGTVFLGLSVGCAQCHDHKYDPVSQREYYQLFAVFNTCDEPKLEVPTPEQIASNAQAKRDELRQKIKQLDEAFLAKKEQFQQDLDAWEAKIKEQPEVREKLPRLVANTINLNVGMRTPADLKELSDYYKTLPESKEKYPELAEVAALKAAEPKFVTTLVMQERSQPRETFVHVRGDFLRKGAKVAPDVPEVFPPWDEAWPRNRVGLAKWLTSETNPLTARVMVNRVWQKYFGRGLVETENDFGLQGTRPTHPELLDWLASEFMAPTVGAAAIEGAPVPSGAWSLKRLHKLLVSSAVYRQASTVRPEVLARDPNNLWLARQSRFRLDAEIVRDAALSASGLLTPTIGGPSVSPPQPEGVFAFTQVKKTWNVPTDGDRFRRAMYTYLWRSAPFAGLTVFDFPDSNMACTRRNRSNTPLQSLTLANDVAFVEFAQGFAARILAEGGTDDAGRIRFAVRAALSRDPSEAEQRRLVDYLTTTRAAFVADAAEAEKATTASPLATRFRGSTPAPEFAAWSSLARVVLNLDEFISRE